MKILSSCIAAALFCSSVFAQKEKTPTHVALGFYASPDLCYRSYFNVSGGDSWQNLIEKINANDHVKLGYSLGLPIYVQFSPNWGFETGLQYSNRGYIMGPLPVTFSETETYTLTAVHTFHDLAIPLKANLTLGKKKLRFCASLGVLTNFNLAFQQKTTQVDSLGGIEVNKTTTRSARLFNLSAWASAGIDYALSDRIHLRIEPYFRHDFPITPANNSPIRSFLWTAGLNVGAYLRLGQGSKRSDKR